MKTQEIAIKGKSKIDVTLSDDAKALDEVVVIGYGTAKRKSIFAHDPGGKVAEGYRNLTKEVLKLEKQREKNRAGLGR